MKRIKRKKNGEGKWRWNGQVKGMGKERCRMEGRGRKL